MVGVPIKNFTTNAIAIAISILYTHSNAFFNFFNDAEKLKSQFLIEPQGTLVPGLYYTISFVLKDDNEEVLMDKNYSFKVSDDFTTY